jgi:hypothetical protein
MSKLTDELEYILNWLKSTNLELVDSYNSGLLHPEIDTIVKNLPFKLSDEIYELYQWRNGVADLGFNNYHLPVEFLFPEQLFNYSPIPFTTLQESVSNYHDLCQVSQDTMDVSSDYEFWNQKWFPFASFENKRILYIVGDLNPSPVYLWNLGCCDNPVRVYRDLTNMISMIAECCELDLYRLIQNDDGDDENDEMIIRIDEEKLNLEQEIYQKYKL